MLFSVKEGFWGTIKSEKYYLHKYLTFDALKNDIDHKTFWWVNRYMDYGLAPLTEDSTDC
jgi:hypothetical protein